jgi:hypothetical protein
MAKCIYMLNFVLWLLVIYLSISGVTHMENDLLFCSKLMFTNGRIIVYDTILFISLLLSVILLK